MWKRLYDSPWHNPGAFVLANVLVLLFALRIRGPMRAFMLVFTAEILLDTTLTNDYAPVSRAIAAYLGIPFVILGDARLLVLLERARRAKTVAALAESPSRTIRRATLAGLGLALVVPVLQTVALKSAPAYFAVSRRIFLAYELLFFAALTLYAAIALRPALAHAERSVRRWAFALVAFALVQYACWATADIVILRGNDQGFALRLIANALYYVAFLPFAWASAPAALRGDESGIERP